VPWVVSDLLLLYLANVAGLLLILVAWFEASGAVDLNAQIVWLNVGAIGVIVAGSGNVLWLLTGRRGVGELRQALTPALSAHFAQVGELTGGGTVAPTTSFEPRVEDPGLFVSGADMTRYHRPECLLVRDKEVRAAPATRHRARGLQPCQVCGSGEPDADHNGAGEHEAAR
jgi:hypothetical protein